MKVIKLVKGLLNYFSLKFLLIQDLLYLIAIGLRNLFFFFFHSFTKVNVLGMVAQSVVCPLRKQRYRDLPSGTNFRGKNSLFP